MLPVAPRTEHDPLDNRLPEVDRGNAPPGGCFLFKPETLADATPPIYRTLADHQCSEEKWKHRNLLVELHRWAGIFEREFTLNVPEVAMAIEKLRGAALGQYHCGHNGFVLKGEITIGLHHLEDEFWDVLGTLLHELLHGWQEVHGKSSRWNYHNKQYREKARQCGLVVDGHGRTQYEPDGRFFQVLARHGVRVPELPKPTRTERPRTGSKLKKWSCGCTNVRVAVSSFSAQCLHCNREFTPAEPLWHG